LVKPLPELKKRILTAKQLKLNNFSAGQIAEAKAEDFLKKKNYLILEKNLKYKNFEIDLIAIDQKYDELVFVEVKYRKNDNFGDASLAVNQQKINKMHRVAGGYLAKKKFKKDYRFDIISVVGNLNQKDLKIKHFENISWP
jgi:putative endonuclease